MEFATEFWEKARRHWFWGIVLLVLLGLAVVERLLGGIVRIKNGLAPLLLHATYPDPTTGGLLIKQGYAWALVVILVLILAGLLFALRVWYERNRVVRQLSDLENEQKKRHMVIEKTFEKMVLAVSQIRRQFYPESFQPQKNLVSAYRTYIVSGNFDTLVIREDEYKAITDLHIEHIRIGAEPHADPCEFLDDINFKVRDEDPANEVVYLPSQNAQFQKSVLLFFLPHIRPDEAKPRKIIVSYKWPGMLRQLGVRGFEIGEWTLKSKDPIPVAEMKVFFSPELRRRVGVSIHGKRLAGDQLDHCVCHVPNYEGWEGYCYKLTNAPPGTYHIRIDMSRGS